jgi:hypothetical protein
MAAIYNDATLKMESMEEGIIGTQPASWQKESSTASTVSLNHKQKYKIAFVLILMVGLISIAAFFVVRSIGKRQITAQFWVEDGYHAGN